MLTYRPHRIHPSRLGCRLQPWCVCRSRSICWGRAGSPRSTGSGASRQCTLQCSPHVWQRWRREGLYLRLQFVRLAREPFVAVSRSLSQKKDKGDRLLVVFGLNMESCEAAVVAHDGGRVEDPWLKLCDRYRHRFRADRGVRRGLRPSRKARGRSP